MGCKASDMLCEINDYLTSMSVITYAKTESNNKRACVTLINEYPSDSQLGAHLAACERNKKLN